MISNDKKITLITGANSGIGFALAQLLISDASNIVLLGARSPSKGQAALENLQTQNLPGTASLVQIDVTSEPSVKAAATHISSRFRRIDALVNNAGIAGAYSDTGADLPCGQTLSAQLISSLTTNAVGPALTVHCFAPLLALSAHKLRALSMSRVARAR